MAGALITTFLTRALPVFGRFRGIGEQAGRFDDDFDVFFAPGDVARISLREKTRIFLPLMTRSLPSAIDSAVKTAVVAVVFEQMGVGR